MDIDLQGSDDDGYMEFVLYGRVGQIKLASTMCEELIGTVLADYRETKKVRAKGKGFRKVYGVW